MGLQSKLLKDDPKLEACLISDPAHVMQGAGGDHVSKIQTGLLILDSLIIDPSELSAKRYGPSTAAAVLAFKKKRNIINRSYQSQADDIVGKMTIAALDRELVTKEGEEGKTTFLSRKLPPLDTTMGIQRRLNQVGFDAGPEDGVYGPRTTAAVKRFQEFCKRNAGKGDPHIIDAGPVDGIAGPLTKQALLRFYGS